jgi:hypothetical protein
LIDKICQLSILGRYACHELAVDFLAVLRRRGRVFLRRKDVELRSDLVLFLFALVPLVLLVVVIVILRRGRPDGVLVSRPNAQQPLGTRQALVEVDEQLDEALFGPEVGTGGEQRGQGGMRCGEAGLDLLGKGTPAGGLEVSKRDGVTCDNQEAGTELLALA